MPQISIVVNFSERGFSVVRLPRDYVMPAVTVQQQAAEPKAGIVCSSGALSDLARAMNETISEATGQPCSAVTISADSKVAHYEWIKLNLQGSKLLPSQAAELKRIIDEATDK